MENQSPFVLSNDQRICYISGREFTSGVGKEVSVNPKMCSLMMKRLARYMGRKSRKGGLTFVYAPSLLIERFVRYQGQNLPVE